MRVGYDRTTTIEREWLAQIIAGAKKIEYHPVKPYWTKRWCFSPRKGGHFARSFVSFRQSCVIANF
jgi:hypothetical protein